jgi:hypothetical protein
MKDLTFLTKGQQINAGNHIISVGSFNTQDIAIISKHTGAFVKFKDIPKKGSPLNKIKLTFKNFLCSNNDLVFQRLWASDVQQIVKILKKSKK